MAKNKGKSVPKAKPVTTQPELLTEAEVTETLAAIDAASASTEPVEAPAVKVRPAVVLGKYAKKIAARDNDAFKIDPKWKPLDKVLKVGRSLPAKTTSVMGILTGMMQRNPGVTGRGLVELMLAHTWTDLHPSAYVDGDRVTADWCKDYVSGALSRKLAHLAVDTKATEARVKASAVVETTPPVPEPASDPIGDQPTETAPVASQPTTEPTTEPVSQAA